MYIKPESELDLKCPLTPELKLIVFKCKTCREQCAFGKYIIREFDEWELDSYHNKH